MKTYCFQNFLAALVLLFEIKKLSDWPHETARLVTH